MASTAVTRLSSTTAKLTFASAAPRPRSSIRRVPTAQSLSQAEAVRFFLMVTSTVALRGWMFDNGYLDISSHQSGVTIGSIEGDGDVFLGANDLTVGTNNMNTVFLRLHRRQRFARQGRQWDTHFASQLLHWGHRRSNSRARLNYQARLYWASRRNRIFNGRRRFATAGHIWRSNERRAKYPS